MRDTPLTDVPERFRTRLRCCSRCYIDRASVPQSSSRSQVPLVAKRSAVLAAADPPEFEDFERECFGDEDGCDLWSRRASVSHAVERFSSVEGGFRTVL